jgi:hypothetical protein
MTGEEGRMPKENPEDRIDPRYNAAFQRAYQGPDAVAADSVRPSGRPIVRSPRSAEPAAAVPRAAPEAPEPARTVPSDESDWLGESGEALDLEVQSSRVSDSDESALSEGHSRPTEELSARPGPPARENPYFTALWVIAIVFVAGGVIFQVWAQLTSFAGTFERPGTVPIQSVIVDVAFAVCGPAITVGLATIVALLFVRALGVRRVRRDRP